MIFHKQELLQKELTSYYAKKQAIGFVPTMGALHNGHLSLVQRALDENDLVVVSIFVNPTQFGNANDLDSYPRTLEEDAKLLKTLKGNILIYAPQPEDLYGQKVDSKKYRFGPIEYAMEGKFRPGHFNGVGTVLNLLFRAIRPGKAYFGEKDFQQLQVVRKLVAVEKLDISIIGCAILREAHGLAMSSRNKRLSKTLFQESVIIFNTLTWVQEHFKTKSINKLQAHVQKIFEDNPYLELEYFEIAKKTSLATAHRKRRGNEYRAFIAAYAGGVRLIDNMSLPKI